MRAAVEVSYPRTVSERAHGCRGVGCFLLASVSRYASVRRRKKSVSKPRNSRKVGAELSVDPSDRPLQLSINNLHPRSAHPLTAPSQLTHSSPASKDKDGIRSTNHRRRAKRRLPPLFATGALTRKGRGTPGQRRPRPRSVPAARRGASPGARGTQASGRGFAARVHAVGERPL